MPQFLQDPLQAEQAETTRNEQTRRGLVVFSVTLFAHTLAVIVILIFLNREYGMNWRDYWQNQSAIELSSGSPEQQSRFSDISLFQLQQMPRAFAQRLSAPPASMIALPDERTLMDAEERQLRAQIEAELRAEEEAKRLAMEEAQQAEQAAAQDQDLASTEAPISATSEASENSPASPEDQAPRVATTTQVELPVAEPEASAETQPEEQPQAEVAETPEPELPEAPEAPESPDEKILTQVELAQEELTQENPPQAPGFFIPPEPKPQAPPIEPLEQESRVPEIEPLELEPEMLPESVLEVIPLEPERSAPSMPAAPPIEPLLDQVLEPQLIEEELEVIEAEPLSQNSELSPQAKSIQAYNAQVGQAFYRNWRRPVNQTGRPLSATLNIQIQRSGQVQSNLQRASGNAQLDQSLRVLIANMRQVQALPSSIPGQVHRLTLEFQLDAETQ